MSNQKKMSRRQFLQMAAGAFAGTFLAAYPGLALGKQLGLGANRATRLQDLNLTLWIDTLFGPSFSEISQGFTDEYGVGMEVQALSLDEVLAQFLRAAPVGEGPDLIEGPHDWLGQLVAAGLVEPLDLGTKAENIVPFALNAWSMDGKLYGLGLITENVALFRNADLVPEAPQTWEELEAVCKGLDVEYKLLMEVHPYSHFPILTSWGGYLFGQKEDGSYDTSDVGLDNEGALESARWLDRMIKEGIMPPNMTFDAARTLFAEGEAAFYITGPWNLPFFRESGMNYAISAVPAGNKASQPFTGVRGLVVNKFSQNVALAQAYLTEFWASDTPMQKLYDLTGKSVSWIPVRDKIDNVDLVALNEAGKEGLPMPSVLAMGAYWTAGGEALTLIMNQDTDPEEAFKTWANAVREAVKSTQ